MAQKQKQRKKFVIATRVEREGFEDAHERVRLTVRVVDEKGLIVVGAPSKTITLHKVSVAEVWEAILSVLDR